MEKDIQLRNCDLPDGKDFKFQSKRINLKKISEIQKKMALKGNSIRGIIVILVIGENDSLVSKIGVFVEEQPNCWERVYYYI